MRDIKFKFWLGHINKMTYEHSLSEIGKVIPNFSEDIIPLQYTGAKDKSGKEVYERDFIKVIKKNKSWHSINEFKGVVEFDNSLQYIVRHKSDWVDLSNPEFEIEVIGNFYENPELLK